jgi:alkaline phosphatase D
VKKVIVIATFWILWIGLLGCGLISKPSSVPYKTDASKPAEKLDSITKIEKESPNQPLKIGKVIETIGFGSCMDQNYPEPVWQALKAENLDLFIALGDIVYASASKDKPISKAYLKQIENTVLNEFRATVPWIGVWDDHDFGVNDGGGDHIEFEEAKAHLQAFLPNSAKVTPPNQKGVYHSIILGNKPKTLQVIVLDTRTFRSPLKPDTSGDPFRRYQATFDTSTTILGEEQWRWLETELQKPANFRILVSSIQVLPEQHGFEKWANFPHERKRLLQLIEKNKLKNLVLLSGDRHFAEVSQLKLNKKHSLLEITSSGLNKSSQLQNEKNALRLGVPFFESNYGVLKIDYMKKTAFYRLKSSDGKLICEHRIRF